jgi:hypothetical protein
MQQLSVFTWEEKTSFLKISPEIKNKGIGGSVVECSPATRAARVRFPADAICDSIV